MKINITFEPEDFNNTNFITNTVYDRIDFNGFYIKRDLVLQWCSEICNTGQTGKHQIERFVDNKIKELYNSRKRY